MKGIRTRNFYQVVINSSHPVAALQNLQAAVLAGTPESEGCLRPVFNNMSWLPRVKLAPRIEVGSPGVNILYCLEEWRANSQFHT
jgi:hypothetical protein